MVFGGRVDDAIATETQGPVLAYVPIVRGITDLPTALRDGQTNLELATAMACQLLLAAPER